MIKAFDSFWHEGLFYKLLKTNIGGNNSVKTKLSLFHIPVSSHFENFSSLVLAMPDCLISKIQTRANCFSMTCIYGSQQILSYFFVNLTSLAKIKHIRLILQRIVTALGLLLVFSVTPFKIDQNKNQNRSIDKVQNLGNERRYTYKDPRQDLDRRNISYTRYPKKCLTQS